MTQGPVTLFTLSHHWVEQARHLPSPNAGARPDPDDISLIVVHNISLPPGEFGGGHVDALFTNCLDTTAHPWFEQLQGLEVSSHFLIDRAGELTQYVGCDRRAWHAGRSAWRGRAECNDFAIGIELEGVDDIAYEAVQYTTLAELVTALQQAYAMATDAVAGHEDVAPGRKTDPGPAFDWPRFWRELADRHGPKGERRA